MRRHPNIFAALIALLLAVLGGCAKDLHSPESALNPAGQQARQIGSLTWLFIWVCVVVYVLVMIFLAWALIRRRRDEAAMTPSNEPLEPKPSHERQIWTTVFGAIGVTIVTLFVLLVSDFATGRSLHKFADNSTEVVRIRIIARQWWWEVRYEDWPERFGMRAPSQHVTSANEIHIPIDPQHPIAVELQLEARDVIHSFWVPSLTGKRDMIPGHPASIWFSADTPGVYYGECAEYCGYQHAQMRFAVVAESADQFKAWLEAQRQPAPQPVTDTQKRGHDVVMRSSCIMCHKIAGTEARGLVGPDLTHVASRSMIAAGALPNTSGHRAGWIIDPQKIKPGTQMPQVRLSPTDLRAVLEYLDTLK